MRHAPWLFFGVLVVLGLLWPYLLLFAFFVLIVAVASALGGGRKR